MLVFRKILGAYLMDDPLLDPFQDNELFLYPRFGGLSPMVYPQRSN